MDIRPEVDTSAAPLRAADVVAAWAEGLCNEGVVEACAYAWEPEATVAVVGLGQDVERELRQEALQCDRVPVLRRASGGGAVVLARGCLCFGFIASPGWLGAASGIHGAYEQLTAAVRTLLAKRGLAVSLRGISDIAVTVDGEQYKVAGCAQLRRKEAILVHGSLLVDVDPGLFEAYLQFPSAAPDYRKQRGHAAFCRGLSVLLNQDVRVPDVADGLRALARAQGFEWLAVPASLAGEGQMLWQEKYGREAWNLRRERPRRRRAPRGAGPAGQSGSD